jgi:hypothetical protein
VTSPGFWVRVEDRQLLAFTMENWPRPQMSTFDVRGLGRGASASAHTPPT